MDNNNTSQYVKINLASYLIDEDIIKQVPGALVKKFHFMPVFKIGNTLTIATAEPDNLITLDEVRKNLGMEIDALFAESDDIDNAITQHYGLMDLIETYATTASEEKVDLPKTILDETIKISADKMEDSSIVNLVNLIINQAFLKHASDIHIEPAENDVLIRLRVDGELYELKKLEKQLLSPIVSRIKVIAGMDIAETRIPQDGYIKMNIDNKVLELRVSSLPMIHGENIVIRLLSKGDIEFGLDQLGFRGKDAEQFGRLVTSPFGMILVTGPTGSGKTTTLYAALTAINKSTKNIITLEDPVEHQLPLIRQVQVNPKAGLEFSTGLRSVLRQDPDIIMVGEIRDLETVELAIRSALTGHLVLSTLHTNDAPSALIRLSDMGVEPFLISSAVIGILAQRLVRKICSKCKAPYAPSKNEIEFLELDSSKELFKGRGCKTCGQSGYRGRIGVFELMTMSDDIKSLLTKNKSITEIRNLAISEGMISIKEDALSKIYNGLTTPEEVIKVVKLL
ncbi:GspE/PulE family protein [Candidatus Margulisiibacteriota bacterium]